MDAAKMIATIPQGKVWGISAGKALAAGQEWYCQVRPASGGYEIEAGWRNPNARADFERDDNGIEDWIGVTTVTVPTASAAAARYLRAKEILAKRKMPAAALRDNE